jgi:hypothetical protein
MRQHKGWCPLATLLVVHSCCAGSAFARLSSVECHLLCGARWVCQLHSSAVGQVHNSGC